jgi:predicted lipoprotein with Yx(FWY)xxD motif
MATRSRVVTASVAVVAASGLIVSAAASAAPSAAAHQEVSTVKVHELGKVLANQSGRVMYLFKKDTHNKSNCGTKCQAVWPLVTSMGAAKAAGGVSASHLGRLADGEVTYYGHPLYYFAGDTAAKQDTGEGLASFGAKWYAVSPKGNAVDDD